MHSITKTILNISIPEKSPIGYGPTMEPSTTAATTTATKSRSYADVVRAETPPPLSPILVQASYVSTLEQEKTVLLDKLEPPLVFTLNHVSDSVIKRTKRHVRATRSLQVKRSLFRGNDKLHLYLSNGKQLLVSKSDLASKKIGQQCPQVFVGSETVKANFPIRWPRNEVTVDSNGRIKTITILGGNQYLSSIVEGEIINDWRSAMKNNSQLSNEKTVLRHLYGE
jgi:hypothetical protein